MPRHDPLPGPRRWALHRYGRVMRFLALTSLVAAAAAVVLVAGGSEQWRIEMLIATALGAGFSVLLAAALMGLLSSHVGGEQANRFEGTDKE